MSHLKLGHRQVGLLVPGPQATDPGVPDRVNRGDPGVLRRNTEVRSDPELESEFTSHHLSVRVIQESENKQTQTKASRTDQLQ